MIRLLAFVALVGCAPTPEPKTVIVERPVYVYVPERSGPPVPPGEGIAPSPLLIEAERQRAESVSRIPVPPPPADPDDPAAVYIREPMLAAPVYVPTPRTVVIVRDLPASQRKHSRWHYDRAVDRCDTRKTKWARERCYRREAR